jgi:hypothetical protein
VIVIFPAAGMGCMMSAGHVRDGKDAMEPGFAASEIDTATPHPARIYDALLGGKDHYHADQEAVRQVLKAAPEVRDSARRRLFQAARLAFQTHAHRAHQPSHGRQLLWAQQYLVPLEYSIEWLTCAFASRLDVVLVGLPGAAQDRLFAHVPGAQPGRPGVPRRPGEGC